MYEVELSLSVTLFEGKDCVRFTWPAIDLVEDK